ncbi:hypothetical protein KUCAC02_007760 [Chaenocephalus aceratus]|uniref:Uncharacterized protein n=1 Tax=Chaenocephalus aceratus TaxID=36190 RepID=A0ACB9X6I8_CHAAC|nr:hypothetical protein KUCAC02_007760 [Chaenocephalus aceratus]
MKVSSAVVMKVSSAVVMKVSSAVVMKVSSGANEGAVCSTPLFMETTRPPNTILCDGEHALTLNTKKHQPICLNVSVLDGGC